MYMLAMFTLLLLSGCTTPIMLPSSGAWDGASELGPVYACNGGTFSSDEGCSGWPLALVSMPSPETHYAELRAKAAKQFHVDPDRIALKDVSVEYLTEINGVIRGWKATAIAGKRNASIQASPLTIKE